MNDFTNLLFSPINLFDTFSFGEHVISFTMNSLVVQDFVGVFQQVINDYPEYNLVFLLYDSNDPNCARVTLTRRDMYNPILQDPNFWELEDIPVLHTEQETHINLQ